MTGTKCIRISQDFETSPATELFSVLEWIFGIGFIIDARNSGYIAGHIIIGGDGKGNSAADSGNTPSLCVPPTASTGQTWAEVEFSDDLEVPFPYRGRRVSIKRVEVGSVLTLRPGEKILASTRLGPIWTVSTIGLTKHFRSALPLPSISAEQSFCDVFNGERFLEMLVLLHFLREAGIGELYRNPILRAGFIIDDPNLHWHSYGFVDYREIVAHAIRDNYHVSFATIPLDTWFTHAPTADLFRRNAHWLSLLIHGNNHTKRELTRNYTGATRRALLRQAIRRIERLEQRANLRVCRIMVPPHGACSEAMLAELVRCGFEAAYISAGSLRAHNLGKQWTKTLGFFPAEMIAGCPVLPRWGLTGNVKNTLLTAAYLGQPMVLRGHHQDFKDGVEVFDEYARFINSLGNVYWSNMSDLSRLSYLWRIDGDSCRIKPLGRNLVLKLPEEAKNIIIEPIAETHRFSDWQAVFGDGSVHRIRADEPFSLQASISNGISIKCSASPPPEPDTKSDYPVRPSLLLRRLLTEARDRLLIA